VADSTGDAAQRDAGVEELGDLEVAKAMQVDPARQLHAVAQSAERSGRARRVQRLQPAGLVCEHAGVVTELDAAQRARLGVAVPVVEQPVERERRQRDRAVLVGLLVSFS